MHPLDPLDYQVREVGTHQITQDKRLVGIDLALVRIDEDFVELEQRMTRLEWRSLFFGIGGFLAGIVAAMLVLGVRF